MNIKAYRQSAVNEVRMPTLNMPSKEKNDDVILPKTSRPEFARYRLQIDRQTKESFNSFEAAEKKAKAIKKAFPVVHVAVLDAEEGNRTAIG